MLARVAPIALVAALAAGCAASPALRAARAGDRDALAAALADESKRGGPSDREARKLALAVAARELAGGGEREVDATLAALEPCRREAAGAIASRADAEDDGAAVATFALLDMGERGPGRLAKKHAHDASAAWRAVAARAATSEGDAELRRAATLDPDERVRLGALRAAGDAGDAGDLPALLDALRRDPSEPARAAAAEGTGAAADPDAVLRLADAWARADEQVRRAVVRGLATPAARGAGGLRELERIADGRGLAAVDAAAVLVGAGAPWSAAGTAALARLACDGTSRERIAALDAAPATTPGLAELVRDAAASHDPAVAAPALVRRAAAPDAREASLERLRDLAKSGAAPALLALARLRDPAAGPLLEGAARSPSAAQRATALRGLAALGGPRAAAPGLADADRSVRLAAVCAVLGGGRPDDASR